MDGTHLEWTTGETIFAGRGSVDCGHEYLWI